jgi:hypothetical protein
VHADDSTTAIFETDLQGSFFFTTELPLGAIGLRVIRKRACELHDFVHPTNSFALCLQKTALFVIGKWEKKIDNNSAGCAYLGDHT